VAILLLSVVLLDGGRSRFYQLMVVHFDVDVVIWLPV